MVPNGWSGGHEMSTWGGPSTLRLHPQGSAFSVIRDWNGEAGRYEGWYVNLEAPWQRTAIGFDSVDRVLDLRLADDLGSWSWKDEDEFAWAADVGLLTPAEARATRAEGERVLMLIEGRAWPFDADWERWAPDAEWDLPTLPSNWATPSP